MYVHVIYASTDWLASYSSSTARCPLCACIHVRLRCYLRWCVYSCRSWPYYFSSSARCPLRACIHAYFCTPTPTPAPPHTQTHTHADRQARARSHPPLHSPTFSLTHSLTHTLNPSLHSFTHSLTGSGACGPRQQRICMHVCVDIDIYTYTHMWTDRVGGLRPSAAAHMHACVC